MFSSQNWEPKSKRKPFSNTFSNIQSKRSTHPAFQQSANLASFSSPNGLENLSAFSCFISKFSMIIYSKGKFFTTEQKKTKPEKQINFISFQLTFNQEEYIQNSNKIKNKINYFIQYDLFSLFPSGTAAIFPMLFVIFF